MIITTENLLNIDFELKNTLENSILDYIQFSFI